MVWIMQLYYFLANLPVIRRSHDPNHDGHMITIERSHDHFFFHRGYQVDGIGGTRDSTQPDTDPGRNS